MKKSHYGRRIGRDYYCLECPIPAVAPCHEVYGDEADKRCHSCLKTLREVVEEQDTSEDFTL